MVRKPHPKKEVEEALRHAEAHGWRVEVGGSHACGRIYCPYNDDECRCGEFCIASVQGLYSQSDWARRESDFVSEQAKRPPWC